MKKDIRFRAWDKGNEQMIYPLPESRNTSGDLLNRWDDENIMRYTGLDDKNGEEIYEGDIIKWPIGYNNFTTVTMYVGYNELGMRLYKRLPCECCGGHKGGSIPSFGIFRKCEVIGNIYENPDLL